MQPAPDRGERHEGAHGAQDDEGEAVWSLPERMGLAHEIARLRDFLAEWLDSCDPDVQEMARYQLSGPAKYFRPVTVFACHRAATGGEPPDDVVRLAAAAELFHNYALVLDDIIDNDQVRRGKLALHYRFGRHPALMVGAYFAFSAAEFIARDRYATTAFTNLGKRIAAVERRQWRVRRQPSGTEAWRRIAGEDTGAMFESCARVAVRDESLARFGYLLGTLYHGCDDVADIRGTEALGAHSEQDITDRILTLPASIATRDADTARLFAEGGPEVEHELVARLAAALPEAEAVLDAIAREAEDEARAHARTPAPLLELVRYTRALSAA